MVNSECAANPIASTTGFGLRNLKLAVEVAISKYDKRKNVSKVRQLSPKAILRFLSRSQFFGSRHA